MEKTKQILFTIFKAWVWISIIYFVLFLCPAPGFAADATITTTSIQSAASSASDVNLSGMGMLRKLFGDVVDNPLSPSSTSASETALGQIFLVLNMSILAIGAMFLAYNVTAGVAQTAQDGEFLGKRFSSLWIPIRMATGIVSLVPVFKGYALAQLIILYGCVLGVGIANLATASISKFLDAGGTVVSIPVSQANSKFVGELYKIHLCVEGANVAGASNQMSASKNAGVLSYGLGGGNYCGEVTLPTSSNPSVQAASQQAFDLVDALLAAHAKSLTKDMAAAHVVGSKTTVNNSDMDIKTWSEIYQTTLRRNLTTAIKGDTHIKDELANIGFAGLGIKYSKMSGAASAQADAMQVQASISKPAPDIDKGGLVGEIYRLTSIIVFHPESAQVKTESSSKVTLDENAILRKFNKEALAAIPAGCNGAQPINTSSAGILSAAIAASGCDPDAISRMRTTGSTLSLIGWIGAGIGAVASAAAEYLPMGKAVSFFSNLLSDAGLAMAFFGSMLQTYLPLIPYITWLAAIISWLTICVEGVVAAPLWAFAHLDTDGEGMGNKAAHGYSFLIQVILRPVLMVVGFVASISIINIIGTFFFSTYAYAVADINGNSFVGLVNTIILIGIFFTTSVLIVTTSINLVHVIPDAVLAWITQGTASSGVASGITGQFGVAAAGATGVGVSMMQSSINKARSGKEKKMNSDDKDTSSKSREGRKE